MKKPTAFSTAILILLVTLAGCSQNNGIPSNENESGDRTKVYSISGENEFIVISNGEIIITAEFEEFVGGELSFKGEELSGIKDYRTEFYFYLNGDKTIINSNTSSIVGSEEGMSIAPDLGSTSSEKMFSAEVWDIITEPDSLHFSLSGTLINGETFEYSIVLNVRENDNITLPG